MGVPEELDAEQAQHELLAATGLAVKLMRDKAQIFDDLLGPGNADAGALRACANDLSLRIYNVMDNTADIDVSQ